MEAGPELSPRLHIGLGFTEALPCRSITLHHRIRQASNPFAPEVRAFDARLQREEAFSREDLAS